MTINLTRKTTEPSELSEPSEPTQPAATPRPVKSQWARRQQVLTAALPLVLTILLCVAFGLLKRQFLSTTNFTTLLTQGGPLLLIAAGATFVMLTGGIDLSVAGTASFAGAIVAKGMVDWHMGRWSVLIGLLAGAVVGLVNGLIVTKLKLPSFIVTLGMSTVLAGVTLDVLNGQSLLLTDVDFGNIAIGQLIPKVPNVALCALIVWVVLVGVNARTRLGRYVVAVGAGEQVARLAGVKVDRQKIYTFVISGVTASIGGIMLLAYLGSATPDLASTYLLLSVAAIVVGGTSLAGGVGGVHRTVVGVVLLTVVTDGLNVMGVSSFTQEIIQGVVVIAAVLFTLDRRQLHGAVK